MWQWLMSLVLLASFGSLLAFCLVSFMAMDMEASSCVMAIHNVMCPMDLQKQLAFSQQVLITVGSKSILALCLLAAAMIVFSKWVGQQRILRAQEAYWRYVFWRIQVVFDYLMAQFAQGILQPKIY